MHNKKKTITEKIETKTNSSKIENHFCAGRSPLFMIREKIWKITICFPSWTMEKNWTYIKHSHCMKSAHVRNYFRPHFPTFGLNTERYWVSLRIQSECGKIRTRRTPNTDTFYAVSEERVHWWRVFLLKLTFFNENMKIWYKMKVCLDDKTDSFSSKHVIL